MNDADDYRFLPFFLREPVYVVDEPERPEPKPVPRVIPSVPALGAGQQEILILVHEPNYEFLSPSDLAFLKKILAAVSLGTEDITLVNWVRWLGDEQEGFSTDELLSPFVYRTALVFGNAPDDWSAYPFLKSYAVTESEAGTSLLQADSLSAIVSDVDKKAHLWKCLQQLFPSASS